MIQLSDKLTHKLMESTFGAEYSLNFVQSFVQWLIDSKYRTYKRLDKFISEQLDNPSSFVLEYTKRFDKYKDDYDKLIIEILRFVRSYITYMHDIDNYNKIEYWATAEEVLNHKKDDCDGMNSLIHILARLCGIPSYLLYSVIGDVAEGGHYWLVYLSPKTGKLYTIDATYYYDNRAIQYRPQMNTNRYTKLWYVFNDKHIWRPI